MTAYAACGVETGGDVTVVLQRGVAVKVVVGLLAAAAALALALGPLSGGGDEASPDEPSRAARTDPTPGSERAPGDEGAPADAAAIAEEVERRDPDDPTAMGPVDAPVVMVLYADFRCPHCGRYARDTAPQLVERYVADGTLRIEWRDFPYLGDASQVAALAARAAAEQDAFWAFHDALFAAQDRDLHEDALVAIAADLGLDVERFRADLRSDDVAAAVARDFAEGQALGVTGTPAFLINGRPLLGAHDAAVFAEVIETAAAEATS